MRLLRQPLFLTIALSHFAVDTLSAQVGILLAVLSTRNGMGYATIGLVATVYSVLTAVAQPAFGWLADRDGGRWTAVAGVLWMGACFSLLAVTSGPWPIVFLLAAALGTAGFHPTGSNQAVELGHRNLGGQAATAASIFFLFGQAGWGVGPAIGGVLLERLGTPGLLFLSALALVAGLLMAWPKWPTRGETSEAPRPTQATAPPPARPSLGLFAMAILVATLPAWALSACFTFVPKFLQDQGVLPSIYGVVVALFMAGSAVGGVIAAIFSDRWSMRGTLALAMAGSALPLFFFPTAALAESGWMYALALAAGLLAGGPHSILFTVAQRSMPGKAAFASGMALGFLFSASALGTYLSGLAAERYGLLLTLQANALLVLCGALLSLTLRAEPRVTPQAVWTAAD